MNEHLMNNEALALLVSGLDLKRKVALCANVGPWHTAGLAKLGLAPIAMSDGPAGIRGTETELAEVRLLNGTALAVSFPAPSALAATWDVDLALLMGRALGSEAVREKVDVVLGPVVNLQRTPVGGRHFECFSEDPLLTGVIGTAMVEGIQGCGVAACVKHLVGNEAETQRTTSISRIDERTLREVYLAPFEMLIRVGGAWSVMASYNRLLTRGICEKTVSHPWLLDDLLRTEWGFDGLVVSDWAAATDTDSTARHGLDLVMPGPETVWTDGRLLHSVLSGRVSEAAVDAKVANLLRLASRVGALGARCTQRELISRGDARGLARRIAAQSCVVLADGGWRLPLADVPATIALIGPNAVDPYLQGGGSSSIPLGHVRTLADELRGVWPHAEITVLRGVNSRSKPPLVTVDSLRDPKTSAPGVRLDQLDSQGSRMSSEIEPCWPGVRRGLGSEVSDLRLRTVVSLFGDGRHWIGVSTIGQHRIAIDGVEVSASDARVGEEVVLDSSANNPEAVGVSLDVVGSRTVEIDVTVQNVDAGGFGSFARAGIHHLPPTDSERELLIQAVKAAARADLTLVVVGTNEEVESEGWDRTDLSLPGRQDELVEAVLNANPDAIVIVNAGAPVELPWLSDDTTTVWSWLPGQEFAPALADVLTGVVEPAGRLPWTLPRRYSDCPVPDGVPHGNDIVDYTEGVDVGYRGWLRKGLQPARPFGYGLGWTRWRYQSLDCRRTDDGGATVTCQVLNCGRNAGSEVVQCYLEAPGQDLARPVRWLAGFDRVHAAPGEQVTATIHVHRRSFEIWDVERQQWTIPSGQYLVHVGGNLSDTPLNKRLSVDGD